MVTVIHRILTAFNSRANSLLSTYRRCSILVEIAIRNARTLAQYFTNINLYIIDKKITEIKKNSRFIDVLILRLFPTSAFSSARLSKEKSRIKRKSRTTHLLSRRNRPQRNSVTDVDKRWPLKPDKRSHVHTFQFSFCSFHCRRLTQVPPALQVRIRHRAGSFEKKLTDCWPFIKYLRMRDKIWAEVPTSPFLNHPVCLLRFQLSPLIVTNSDICPVRLTKNANRIHMRFFEISSARDKETGKATSKEIS